MATRQAKQLREERSSAVVIAFPMIARRELSAAAALPFPVVPARPSEPVNSKAAPKAANENDRPAPPLIRRGRWWEAAIAASIVTHALIFGAMWERNNYDLERAAGTAAAANDGATVIPIEIVVTAALPSAPTPIEATKPEEDKVAAESARPQEESKKEEKTEAAPQKSDDAVEAVPEAKESPKPQKEKHEQKKKQSSAASRTAAANPSQAAASHSQGRAGAGGRRLESGGMANASSYKMQVSAHLQRYKSYPAGARSAGIRGFAVVRFSLSTSGSVISASLARGSGSADLDRSAVAMVRRASPFPPIPSALGVSRMDFSAPIRFDLR